jgi:hypothetical protein
MQVILKNIVKISLSALIAISVLTLNLSGLLMCSSITMNEDCCHVTKTVKSCCVKKMKITFAERIKGHCGCSVQESQQTADLYHDLKNSNSYSSTRDAQYTSTIETGYHPELISRFTAEYSPPPMDLKDSYLINLSIRI